MIILHVGHFLHFIPSEDHHGAKSQVKFLQTVCKNVNIHLSKGHAAITVQIFGCADLLDRGMLDGGGKT